MSFASANSKNETAELVMQLYDRERANLERFLLFSGAGDATPDIVHDAFIKLHEHLDKGGDQSNLRAWLYRVVRNAAISGKRSLRKTAELSEALPDAAASAETQASMQRALERLPQLERECLMLRAQGFRYREIGEILKLSTSTVGDTVQRAIEKVRQSV